jgi:hypothetical protein
MWWNVKRQVNGSFDIWADGGPHIAARNEAELQRQLAANGVLDEWYEQALTQLANSETARVEIPNLGKFSQGMPPIDSRK